MDSVNVMPDETEDLEDTSDVKWIISITFDNLNWANVSINWYGKHWYWLAKHPFRIFRWQDGD